MADRRCPNCGELVPSTSVTCPRCYKKIPSDRESTPEYKIYNEDGSVHREPKERSTNSKTALLLALIPGLFGLLGLGILYQNPREPRGYALLALGLLVFIVVNFLLFITVGLSFILVLPLIIFYVLLYLASLVLTVFTSSMMVFRI